MNTALIEIYLKSTTVAILELLSYHEKWEVSIAS